MPNRIIKESICTSDSIENLSLEEEVFFYRLIVNCDDYGCMDGRPDIIRAKCFPLRLDKVKAKDVEKWLVTLRHNDLIIQYIVEGKPYIKLTSWEKHQQVRAKRRKFPELDADAQIITDEINGNQMIADDCNSPRNPIRIQSESESESESIYATIVAAYHRSCCSLPRVKELSDKRKKAIKKLLDNGKTLSDFEQVFRYAEESDFLSGRSGKWTSCNFDWLIKPANFTKTIEKTYANRTGNRNTNTADAVTDFFTRRGDSEHRGFNTQTTEDSGDIETIDISLS